MLARPLMPQAKVLRVRSPEARVPALVAARQRQETGKSLAASRSWRVQTRLTRKKPVSF